MIKFDGIQKLAIAGLVASVVFLAAVVWVAWHFISKYW